MQALPLHVISIHPKGELVAFAAREKFLIFNLNTTTFIDSPEFGTNGHTDIIRCISWNDDGTKFATAADDKTVKLWDTASWKFIGQSKLQKKATTVLFAPPATPIKKSEQNNNNINTNEKDCIIFADKFGDVYSASDLSHPQLLLGHSCSTITDMVLSPSKNFLLTCDRDEKIRVNNFPATYNIEQFCLGHTSVVSKLLLPKSFPSLLLSGSVDGTVRVWDYRQGIQLLSLTPDFHQNSESVTKPAISYLAFCEKIHTVAVLLEDQPTVFLYKLTEQPPYLDPMQRITLSSSSAVFSATFENEEQLWLVGSNPSVQLFKKVKEHYEETDSAAKRVILKSAIEASEAVVKATIQSLHVSSMKKKDLKERDSKKPKKDEKKDPEDEN